MPGPGAGEATTRLSLRKVSDQTARGPTYSQPLPGSQTSVPTQTAHPVTQRAVNTGAFLELLHPEGLASSFP